MRFEITEINYTNPVNGNTISRYELFIDNVIVETISVQYKQEPIKVYKYFLNLLVREWKTKYKRIYEKYYGENHHNGQKMFNPKTIVNEDIQDIELILKKAKEFIRLQQMEGDFQ